MPLILYDAQRSQVKVLSGLGRAPMSQEAIDWYMANGIPNDGDVKAAPVPGAVSLCLTALKLYGTISFERAVPVFSRCTMRVVRALVFPVPAPASIRTGPSNASTAARCSELRSSR